MCLAAKKEKQIGQKILGSNWTHIYDIIPDRQSDDCMHLK